MAPPLLSFVLFSGAVLAVSSAAQLEIAPHLIKAADQELSNALQPNDRTEVFSRAIVYLDSLKSEPSCHQLATVDLIDSCKSIGEGSDVGGSSKHLEQLLDITKNEFAVRLAVCELNAAKATIPKSCARFIPSANACDYGKWWSSGRSKQVNKSRSSCYVDSSKKQVEKCIAGLEMKPQSWTSYSNARQNAVVVCQASRERIEKDRYIELFKNMAKNNGDLSAAIDEDLKRHQSAGRAFDSALAHLNDALQTFDSETKTLLDNLSAAGENFLSMIYRSTSKFNDKVESMAKTVDDMDKTVEDARSSLSSLSSGLSTARREISEQQTEDWLLVRQYIMAMAVSLNKSMEATEALEARVSGLQSGMDTLEYAQAKSLQLTEGINKGLRRTAKFFEALGQVIDGASRWIFPALLCIAIFVVGVAFQMLSNAVGRRIAVIVLAILAPASLVARLLNSDFAVAMLGEVSSTFNLKSPMLWIAAGIAFVLTGLVFQTFRQQNRRVAEDDARAPVDRPPQYVPSAPHLVRPKKLPPYPTRWEV